MWRWAAIKKEKYNRGILGVLGCKNKLYINSNMNIILLKLFYLLIAFMMSSYFVYKLNGLRAENYIIILVFTILIYILIDTSLHNKTKIIDNFSEKSEEYVPCNTQACEPSDEYVPCNEQKCLPSEEYVPCNTGSCPVDCKVSDWSKWMECTKSCGTGTRKRTRYIITDSKNNGTPCPVLEEIELCNKQSCAVDCVVSNWSNFSECSKNCGGGKKIRNRKILIKNQFGGSQCPAEEEIFKCNEQPCPINCQVTDWIDWTECTKQCDGGTRSRTRAIKVEPQNGGKPCPIFEETEPCNTKRCPVNCKVGDWVEGECDARCNGGKKKVTRKILVEPKYGGTKCPPLEELNDCNDFPCPVDCKLSEWGKWEKCDKTCGGGTSLRRRKVLIENKFGGKPCDTLIDSKPCNLQPCRVDCAVSTWSDWSECSEKCGSGVQNRFRTIIVQPQAEGAECPHLNETRKCNNEPCPINCKVSNWSEWSRCSKNCNGGTNIRGRSIVVPPQFGGKECPALFESKECNTEKCGIDCKVGDWSKWGECSVKCGGGTQKRTREIIVPQKDEGRPCPPLDQERSCNEGPCPSDCNVSEWSPWTKCSEPCGGGIKLRKRKVENQTAYGGKSCPPLVEVSPCNQYPCPVSCQVSNWTNWSKCTRECGGGMQRRSRKILVSSEDMSYNDCPHLDEVRLCNNVPCPEDSEYGRTYMKNKKAARKELKRIDEKCPEREDAPKCPKGTTECGGMKGFCFDKQRNLTISTFFDEDRDYCPETREGNNRNKPFNIEGVRVWGKRIGVDKNCRILI